MTAAAFPLASFLPRKVLVLGCGYVGLPFASMLRQAGCQVTGWVRSESSATLLRQQGIEPWTGDLSQLESWAGLATDFDGWVHCASSGQGGVEAYERIYCRGLELVGQHLPEARGIFVSSTSVYGQTDGSWVTETSPTEPTSETSRCLVRAEAIARQSGARVARVAGIYGPERGYLLRKFLAGEATVPGDGTRWMNQVHRDDVARALAHLIGLQQASEVVNVADNEPVTYLTYFDWLAQRTGGPMPPNAPENPQRKRGLTNKRVSNALLRSLGWQPHFPSFREGCETLLDLPV